METINGHILLPWLPNWKQTVELRRRWETQVVASVFGSETRSSLRAVARRTLSFTPSIRTLQERSRLDDELRAALQSSKACVPFAGRACVLAADCDADVVQLTAEAWPWAVDDWIFFWEPLTRLYEVGQIEAVDGAELTLVDDVSRTYAARLQVWPLLFGKIDEDNMVAVTSHHGTFTITLTENTPATSAVLGEYVPPDPPADLAIPDMEVGTSFLIR